MTRFLYGDRKRDMNMMNGMRPMHPGEVLREALARRDPPGRAG